MVDRGSRLELRCCGPSARRGCPSSSGDGPIRLPNGTDIHADAADPGIRRAREVDHVTWHDGRADTQRDWNGVSVGSAEVERVTDQELPERFAPTIDEIVELYWRRRAARAA